MSPIKLKYGNTNTFFLRGSGGGLLIDTDYAGTLTSFFREIKQNGISMGDISYILATHYHPDHIGLVSELMRLGARLLLVDIQREQVHFADKIFTRDKHVYQPIDENAAALITCAQSRDFLAKLGISGEIISTPSHSADSISLVLDNGFCFVGDLEPMEYLGAYTENNALKKDWQAIMSRNPQVIYYAHANEKRLDK